MLICGRVFLAFTDTKVNLILNIGQALFPLLVNFNISPELVFYFFRDFFDVDFANFHTLSIIRYPVPTIVPVIKSIKTKVLYLIAGHVYLWILKLKRMRSILYIFWHVDLNSIYCNCCINRTIPSLLIDSTSSSLGDSIIIRVPTVFFSESPVLSKIYFLASSPS